MSATTIALTSTACMFGGALVGIALQRVVPSDHLSGESRESIKLGIGMISLLAALVLGLLVSTAKNNFDTTNTAVVEGSAKTILLDRVLAHYGADTQEIRTDLRRGVSAAIETLWPEERLSHSGLGALERANAMETMLEKIRALRPQTDTERALHALAQELGNEILLIRWIQIEQAQATLPPGLLAALIFWLTMLYVAFGLLAPRNATAIAVLLVGAFSLSTALFLVSEMNLPAEGAIKVSSGPMRKALESLMENP